MQCRSGTSHQSTPPLFPADYIQMAEMGALRMMMELGALDLIPQQGSISYRELAKKLKAEEKLLGKDVVSVQDEHRC